MCFLLLSSCTHEEVKTYNNREFSVKNRFLYYKGIKYTGGIVAFFTDKKNKKYIKYYQKGLLHGEVQKWHVNGNLAERRFYKKGKKIKIHKGWWPDQKNKFEYHFNKEGNYHGSVLNWHTNGLLEKAFHYNNGYEEGSQKMWWPNGKIRANYVVVNGDRFGLIGLKKCNGK